MSSSRDRSPRRAQAFAATTIAKLERGRQARVVKTLGPPYTPQQRRRLEDALSTAVNAAMGLDNPVTRLGFVARHLAAQDTLSEPPEAPPRTSKLSLQQQDDLDALMKNVGRAVNACNGKVGSPLRNVAEHLFMQHRDQEAHKSVEERARVARRFAMRAAAPVTPRQAFVEPAAPTAAEAVEHEKKMEAELESDPLVLEARATAASAFKHFDRDGGGELDKKELFEVLLKLNQVPGATLEQQEKYLDREFRKADSDGSGTVDMDEFVTFYVDLFQQVEAERAARDAFSRFDVDGSNELEKPELFQVLLELDVVLGDTKADKEAFLAAEFKDADADGGGSVDFAEFVAFYTRLKKRMRSSHMAHQKAVLAARKEQRKDASEAFLATDGLMAALKDGEVKLLSARWLLKRAGFEASVVERGGREVTRYVANKAKSSSAPPLPCRQLLEQQSPEAFLSYEQLEELIASLRGVVQGVKAAARDGIDPAPVVAVSHGWESASHPDPQGKTLKSMAAELGRQMASFASWGLSDVGVFYDWSSLPQDTVDVVRTAEDTALMQRALGKMPLLYAHRQTTVILIADQAPPLAPPRAERGWPLYEEALTKLFKEAPPPKRYKLPSAGPTHLWPKIVRVGDDGGAGALEWRAQGPPLAPTQFHAQLTSKVFSQAADRDAVLSGYRTTIEHGFSGLEKLSLARRGWSDSDVRSFAVALKEVECPHVTSLDLSANDMTAAGVEAIGAAVVAGALHSLRVLDLSDCSGMKSLPESISELQELQVLKLDGCIGLTTLPQSFSVMTGLKQLHLTHCQKLLSNAEALAILPSSVQIVSEAKAR